MSYFNNTEGIKKSIMESVGIPRKVIDGQQDSLDALAMAFDMLNKKLGKTEEIPLPPIIRIPSSVFDGTSKTVNRLMGIVDKLAPGTIVQDEQGRPIGVMTGNRNITMDSRFEIQPMALDITTYASIYSNESSNKFTMEAMLKAQERMEKLRREWFVKAANPMMMLSTDALITVDDLKKQEKVKELRLNGNINPTDDLMPNGTMMADNATWANVVAGKRDRDGDILDPVTTVLPPGTSMKNFPELIEEQRQNKLEEIKRQFEDTLKKDAAGLWGKSPLEDMIKSGYGSLEGMSLSGYGVIASGVFGDYPITNKPLGSESLSWLDKPKRIAPNDDYAEFLVWKQQQEATKKEEPKKPKPFRLIVLQEDLDVMAETKEKT